MIHHNIFIGEACTWASSEISCVTVNKDKNILIQLQIVHDDTSDVDDPDEDRKSVPKYIHVFKSKK